MIQTKVKCDSAEGHLYREPPEISLSEAVAEKWWEISDGVSGAIIISQPDSVESFKATAKHACCVRCGRGIVQEMAIELITDHVEEAKNAEDIPY